MSQRLSARLLTIAVLLSVPLAARGEIPVVVAVDTSRSVTASDLERLRTSLGEVLAQLPPDLRLGLVTFDDQAHWRVPLGGGREQVASALGRVDPQGRFTVLYDALFLAARELTDGGVVLVASDGRDENSATTVDDVARLCESHHVRLVVVGIGRRVDEKTLRRLALVSRGASVADPGAGAGPVVRAVEEARAGVLADIAALAPPPAPAPTPATAPPEGAATTAGLPSWLLPVLALLGLGLAVALWLALRRRQPELRSCETCGAHLEAWESSCSRCQLAELEEAARTQGVAAPAPHLEDELDPSVFKKDPLPAGLEGLAHTLVLDEQPVLIARQRGRSARTYSLPKDQVFAVGRAPGVNSLPLDDPTVSAQHFRVVPKDGEFYLVDLDTTNGTLVNQQRVKVRKLSSGDIIQAGSVQLEFSLQLRRVN